MIKIFDRVLDEFFALLGTDLSPLSMHPLLHFMCPLISNQPKIRIRYELFGHLMYFGVVSDLFLEQMLP